MSPCPQCEKPGRHVAVAVPWDEEGRGVLQVLHYCFYHGLWLEDAKDAPAMFAKVEWWLQGFDPDAIQEVAK